MKDTYLDAYEKRAVALELDRSEKTDQPLRMGLTAKGKIYARKDRYSRILLVIILVLAALLLLAISLWK